MPSTATGRRWSRGRLERKRSGVLVVSEDPAFIERVRGMVDQLGIRVIACLGPAASPCFLEDSGVCPLADGVSVVLVHSPPGGTFRYHWRQIPAAEYAQRLQTAHPGTFVILSSRDEDCSGPTGEIAVLHPETALLFLRWGLPAVPTQAPTGALPTTGGGS